MDLVELKKARSMLILLLATCQQTLLALEAAGNVLDTDLTGEIELLWPDDMKAHGVHPPRLRSTTRSSNEAPSGDIPDPGAAAASDPLS